MTISGLVARVSPSAGVPQFGKEWVEGVYVFPLPDKAAVDRMRLHIGDRFIEGEIVKRSRRKRNTSRLASKAKRRALCNSNAPTCLQRRWRTSPR